MPTSVPIISRDYASRRNVTGLRKLSSAVNSLGTSFAALAKGAWGRTRQAGDLVRSRMPTAQYMRDSSAGFLSSWNPALRDAQDEVRGKWRQAAARTIDALHNSGWMSGGIEQASADTIGAGLRLNCSPDVATLGWNDEQHAEWSSIVERRWRAWSNNPLECDARGKRTVPELTDAAIRQNYAFGEVTALLPQIRRPESQTETKVMMVSPHRLSMETDETRRISQGVMVDENGMPTAYRFKKRAGGVETNIDVRARSSKGRPQVIHIFDGTPDQVRGITPLAPILKVLRQHDQLADATLTAALIQTIFAATVKSPGLSDEVFQGFQTNDDDEVPAEMEAFMNAKLSWWQGRSLDLGQHGQIAHLFPGEEFDIKGAQHPGDNYLPFSRNLLREIARCIGITYEALTGDYEGATYSSVRMANAAIWAIIVRRRNRVAVPFVNTIYRTWLEEEIKTGRIPFPGGYQAFLKNRSAATNADWHGPAKPTADDLKTAKAQTERLENCTTSLTYECAEYGLDVDAVMRDRARERRIAQRYELPDPYRERTRQVIDREFEVHDETLREAA